MILSGCRTTKSHIHAIQDTDFYERENGDICYSAEFHTEMLGRIIKDK
jgi:hypothetical protein